MSTVLHKTKLGRARRTLGQLWQVPTFIVGTFALVLVAASAPLRQDPTIREFDDDLDRLRWVVLKKPEKPQPHRALAEGLLARAERFPHKAGEVHYLAGILLGRLADETPADQAGTFRDQALTHLEQALRRGIAQADLPYLHYRLGALLYLQRGDLRRVIQLLSQSVDLQPLDQRSSGYGILVQAYRKLPAPNLEAALEANQNQIHLLEDEEARGRALLLRGEMFLQQHKPREAYKALEQIGAKAPRPLRVPARLLQIRCCEEENLWNRAVGLWLELVPESAHVPGGKGRILYALGLCHVSADPPDYEAAQKAWRDARAVGGAEGQAANLRLAEMLLLGPKADPAGALSHLAMALESVAKPDDFRNPLVDLKQVRALFDKALEKYRTDLPRSQQLAELYQRVAPPGTAQKLLARASEDQARVLHIKAEEAVRAQDPQASLLLSEARVQFRLAGEQYEQAALVLVGQAQAEAWWRSAQCYLPGQEYARAVPVLEHFVKTQSPDPHLAQAFLDLADSYRRLGMVDKATTAYHECIRIPNTPFAYRARYQLALFQIDQKKTKEAEVILEENLKLNLGADREAHEQSLFMLARLVLDRKDYDKARLHLEEAMRQYPQNPMVWRVRDQLGHCYLQIAKKFGDTIDPSGLQKRNQRDWLLKAGDVYQQLGDDLQKRIDDALKHGLAPEADLALLRKARLAEANGAFDLEDYSEALRRYRDLAQKYRRQPESFEAGRQMYRCVVALGPLVSAEQKVRLTDDVHVVVRDTVLDLETLPDDHPAFATTSRRQWLAAFQTIAGHLANPTRPPTSTPPIP